MDMDIERKKILILGGTNFMGKTLLDLLGVSKDIYEVYCLNRGKIYWYKIYLNVFCRNN